MSVFMQIKIKIAAELYFFTFFTPTSLKLLLLKRTVMRKKSPSGPDLFSRPFFLVLMQFCCAGVLSRVEARVDRV